MTSNNQNASRNAIKWNPSESAAVFKIASTLLAADGKQGLTPAIREAQKCLPENRRKTNKGVTMFVHSRRAEIVEALSAISSSASSEVPAVVESNPIVSAVTESIAPSVSATASTGQGISAVSHLGRGRRNIWNKEDITKVLKATADLYETDNFFGVTVSRAMFEAQKTVLPVGLHKTAANMYQYFYRDKVALLEELNTIQYKRKGRASKEVPAVEIGHEGGVSEAVPVLTQGTVAAEVSTQNFEDIFSGIGASMDKVVNTLMLSFEQALLTRAEAIISRLPMVMNQNLETAMQTSLKGTMDKMESAAIKMAASREQIRIRVLVIGPQADQQNAITRAMENVMDIRYISSDEGAKLIKNQLNFAQHVVAMTSKMNHAHYEAIKGHPNLHHVNGGSSSIIAKLEEIYANS